MNRLVFRALLLAFALAAFVVGCGTPTSPTVSTTTTTTTTTTTSTTTTTATLPFSGSLTTGGNFISPPFLAEPGVVTVSMGDMGTNPLLPPVGLGLGTWDGTNCNLVVSTTAATPTTVLTGTVSIPYLLCVRIWDPAGFTPGYVQPYSVSVVYLAAVTP